MNRHMATFNAGCRRYLFMITVYLLTQNVLWIRTFFYVGGGSGIIGSQLFIIPSIFFPNYALLITEILFDIQFSVFVIL